MRIITVHKDSPLEGDLTAECELLSINGHEINDLIDARFHSSSESLKLEYRENGILRIIDIEDWDYRDLGLELEATKIKVCKNKCIFCFIHQQPKGMRRALYVKDDDYRYSFTHGNFITLSTVTEEDFQRIIDQRLSPMYISVHATDDTLRRCIFKNEKLEPILPRLRHLIYNGIRIHTQTVVCPGVNDGDALTQTITELAELHPGIETLAVVPVGLTRYRDRLPDLRTFTSEEGGAVIDQVEALQKKYLKDEGTRFVFPADELFIIAGRPLPPLSYYEEMSQFENGVGMVRQFIVDFNRRKRYLPKKLDKKMKLDIVTGRSAEPFMRSEIMPFLENIPGLEIKLCPVDNEFWGRSVTVSGLLTGGDILKTMQNSSADRILLPPNCLNNDNLFLDDMSFDDLDGKLDGRLGFGSYQIADSLKNVLSGEAR